MSANTLKRRISGARRAAAAAIAASCVLAAGLALAGCGSAASPAASPGASPGASSATGGSTASAAASTSAAAGGGSGGSAGSGSGASVPYPVAVGNTWKYKVMVGTETGTTINKMTAVVPVSDGQQVTTTSTNDLLGSTTTSTATYIFRSDGSIVYPVNQLSSGSNGVSVTGSGVVWPPASVIDSGKPATSDLKLSIKEDGQSFSTTAHITVQGAGTQTVTVPAGTYQATVVNMTEAFSVEGVSLTVEVRTWLASGVGPVKDEVIENIAGASHVTATEELESFTEG